MMKADANRKRCFFVKFKKHFSLTREVNLKIKEFHCENAGLRAIHTEFDADIFISWRRIINARQNIRRITEIFSASTALRLRVFSCFKRFLRFSRSRDIDFCIRTDFYN